MTREGAEPTTTDRLRADIDRGATGEKVAAPDPAAAPMGTDAEAGGAPASAREIKMETRSRHVDPPQQDPQWRPSMPWLAAAAVLAAVIVIFAVFGTG